MPPRSPPRSPRPRKFDPARVRVYLLDNPTAPELACERVISRMGWGRYRMQHPIGRYFADFALLDLGVVVEVDGASHRKPGAPEADTIRESAMARAGWTTVRLWNEEALACTCEQLLRQRVEAAMASTTPRVHEPKPRSTRASGPGKRRKPPTP